MANAVLVANQIGTVTETMEAMRRAARRAGASCFAPPGERRTPSSPTYRGHGADDQDRLAVAASGLPYNRLLEIETELGKAAIFENPPKA